MTDEYIIEEATKDGNLPLLKYLIEEMEYKITSECLLHPCSKKIWLTRHERSTDKVDMLINYILGKCIERKVRFEGEDAITLEDEHPIVFDKIFGHGLVDKFNLIVDVGFDYSAIKVKDDLILEHLNRTKDTVETSIRKYCLNNDTLIILPRIDRDINYMSLEFEYSDSTTCGEVKLDFNRDDSLIIPCIKPNLFETNFVNSLQLRYLLYTEVALQVKTPTKNFKSIKLNVKFDDFHVESLRDN